jgi:two-component system, NarL family, response regulator LiaR
VDKIIKVAVVEDHVITRQGISRLLSDDPSLKMVGEAGDGQEAIRVVNETRPDVVLMDIALPKMNGIEATIKIKQMHPEVAILVLSAYDYDEYLFGLLDAGAAGYLLKNTNDQELVRAIKAVYRGESVLDPSLVRKVIERYRGQRDFYRSAAPKEGLTTRQKEVIKLAANGLTNKAIAQQLGVSNRTIESELRSIFNKLGVGSRTEAVIKSLQNGWLTISDTNLPID